MTDVAGYTLSYLPFRILLERKVPDNSYSVPLDSIHGAN